MEKRVLIVIGFLVQLSVTSAKEECPYEGPKIQNNIKGKDYAVVNPDIPGAYDFRPKLPTKVDTLSREYFGYKIGNDTLCVFSVYVKILRCEQEVSNISDYEGGTNCSNLIWGKSCNAACSDGKVSVGGPAVFTCEVDNSNRTFLQLDKATVCQDSAYALKCPQDMTIYPDSTYSSSASITLDKWTIPMSLDSDGKPWNVESQTAKEIDYEIGRYTNVVTATSSTGEISSCKFDFIIKQLGCTVPEVDDSTIEGASPNRTYYISTYPEKKICKQGYALQPKKNYRDFVLVECAETSPGHPEWKNWYSRNCTKNEIPKICGREVKLDGKKTEVAYFTYDSMEWKGLIEQNVTSCKFGALVDVKKPSMYDLGMTFQTSTSTPLTFDKCFFEVLLYAGDSSLSTPMKQLDCTLKGSVKLKWPTLYFTLVFRVLDSFKSQQHTDYTGNGTILFSMKECSNCALSDLTGLDLIGSEIPFFKFYPFRPCRMDGCVEDSLQMFKLKGAPNTWNELFELRKQKTCNANIEVQSNTKKICFKQVYLKEKRRYNCRPYIDQFLHMFIHLDSFFTLVIKCDDLQGWWCLPQNLPKFENLTITWDLTRVNDVVTDELWVLSVSSGNNSQACSQPIIYTTPTPVKVTRAPKPKDDNSGLSTLMIVRIVIGIISAFCACGICGYCWHCCKKRRSQGTPDAVPDDVGLSMLDEHNGKH